MNIEMRELLSRNLLHYREVFGLSQQEAAEAAGVTRVAYIKAEQGKTEPGNDVLNALCRRYRIRMQDLLQPMEVPACAFLAKVSRNRQQAARRLETIRRVYRQARDRRMLREIVGKDCVADERQLEAVRGEIGRLCASGMSMGRAVRNCLWPSGLYTPESLPVAVDRAGIVLCMMPFVEPGVEGFSFHAPDVGWVIAVNESGEIPFESVVMALAHELGHILQNTAEGDHGSKGRHDRAEDAAARFARELLIPKGAFVSRWNEYGTLPLWERVLNVKREFKVAASTVLHQAIEFHLSMKESYRIFAIQLKERGYTSSPDPLPCGARLCDTMYDTMAVKACVDDEISLSRCAEVLGRPLVEVRKLVNERLRK